VPSVVRRARPEDADAIARVQVDSWRAAYTGLLPDAVIARRTVEERRAAWCRILGEPDSPEHRSFVVLIDDVVHGVASIGPSRDEDAAPDVGELYAIYLDPARWGLGLGRALFAAAVADLRELGRAAVTLWVLDGNARARRFYEAAGMRTDGAAKIEEDEGAELPHVRYRLALRPASAG
jgi:RimJ/RimL family protein N-acetyltransferase